MFLLCMQLRVILSFEEKQFNNLSYPVNVERPKSTNEEQQRQPT